MWSRTHIDFSRRVSPRELPEWMDGDCSYQDFRDCLRSLEKVNRWLLGYRPTLAWLQRLPRGLPTPIPPQQTAAPTAYVDNVDPEGGLDSASGCGRGATRSGDVRAVATGTALRRSMEMTTLTRARMPGGEGYAVFVC